jgi:hypothetical protein
MTDTIADLKPGKRMDDGTIFAGISPETHQPMYTTPADAPDVYAFSEAKNYARKLGTLFHKKAAYGQHDWRLPTKAELNVLFKNRAAIGQFDISGRDDAACYWSSSQDDNLGWRACGQRFSDGSHEYGFTKDRIGPGPQPNYLSVRCVR